MKKETTADRLQLLMKERGLRQADIYELAQPYCKKYGVKLGRNDISQYVNGKILPGQHKLTILGLALNVSEVWLMGYDVPKERISNNSHWSTSFSNYLESVLESTNHSDITATGLSVRRVQELANNSQALLLSEACDVADSLGASLESMVGLRNDAPPVATADERLAEFNRLFSKLSKEQQVLIIQAVKGIAAGK